ncbi:MAG: hypothetical protein ACFFFK_13155, partial [Candidatus Thorarchaeota archaeon]
VEEEEIEVPVDAVEATSEVELHIETESEQASEIAESLFDEQEVEVEVPEPELVEAEIEVADIHAEDSGPAIVIEENTDAMKMAKDIIFEALETDDFDRIIASEIDQASDEEIDTALQAIGSEETFPLENEPEYTDEIDAESLEELETILGPLDRSVGGTGSNQDKDEEEDDDSYLPLNGDTLLELEKLLDSEQEDEKED